jgi:hypothetical protein
MAKQSNKVLSGLIEKVDEVATLYRSVNFGIVESVPPRHLSDEEWEQVAKEAFDGPKRLVPLLGRTYWMQPFQGGNACLYWFGDEEGIDEFKRGVERVAMFLDDHPDAIPGRRKASRQTDDWVMRARTSAKKTRHCGLLRDICILAREDGTLSPLVREARHEAAFSVLEVRSISAVGEILRHLCGVRQEDDSKPVWDADQRTLRFDDKVIKVFKVKAENQERVLTAFQEEGWPAKISDPIPPDAKGIDPKRRLRDTVAALKKRHKTPNAITFRTDGTGEGVVWERVRSRRGQRRQLKRP